MSKGLSFSEIWLIFYENQSSYLKEYFMENNSLKQRDRNSCDISLFASSVYTDYDLWLMNHHPMDGAYNLWIGNFASEEIALNKLRRD